MARHRKPVNVTLPPELLERLQTWMDAQAAPWNRAAAIEQALKEWLDRQERADEKD
ncbi:MAG: ribbon-helix-helix domain-containing protein [Pseudomonadota bacterium]